MVLTMTCIKNVAKPHITW